MERAEGQIGDAGRKSRAGTLLDVHDRRILGIIQSAFPLEPRPYEFIGREVALSEEEVFVRVRKLKAGKIIRRLGANFQSAGLGFHSTLCAAKVPESSLENFVKEVNSHTGVSHNYLRDHEYNVWFTCIGPSRESVCELLDGISRKTGIAIMNLPATRVYKIKVDFQMD
jgi:DNA-binding Lrp family transcriptional regulator